MLHSTAPLIAHAFTDAPITPDWSAESTIPLTGRPNPYGWDPQTWKEKIRRGRVHAVQYPVDVTGLLIPARPSMKMFELEPGDKGFGILRTMLGLKSSFRNFRGFWDWLGLSRYPETQEQISYPDWARGQRPDLPMGVSLIERHGVSGFTLSCAACHAATLFGRPVLGLTNRFPRANEFFVEGKQALKVVGPRILDVVTDASRGELEMYREARETIRNVGVRSPTGYGLDTSLAQVALSLAHRAPNEWADLDPHFASHPRPNLLETYASDSKPAVWWNLKYKTRWGSDGATISGNPLYMVLLWNELGRGTDLRALSQWLDRNQSVIEELTTAVFATEAPRWNDFLGAVAPIQVERARRGGEIFAQNCAHCHGQYQKDWSHGVETVGVRYFEKSRVMDVGTNGQRAFGMSAFAETLNGLAYSRKYGVMTTVQKGYVPPPLEGVWARYPYLHNNSIPNLCALMTPPAERPRQFYIGHPLVPGRDYDLDCVGYPSAASAPAEWKKNPDLLHDTTRPGLSNDGHYERIFTVDGKERYTPDQKRDLREFLKTL